MEENGEEEKSSCYSYQDIVITVIQHNIRFDISIELE